MKSLQLQLAVLAHQGRICGVSLDRDALTVETRYAHEGEHFLEVVLPTLDDTLLEGLERGLLVYNRHFPPGSYDSRPRFLRPLWALIFDEDGLILDEPSPRAITAIRQVSRLSKKIHEVCADDLVASAVDRFCEVDEHLSVPALDTMLATRLADVIDAVFGRFLRSQDWTVVDGRHGPGAVAEKHDLVGRWDFGPHNEEILSAFPSPLPTVYSMPYDTVPGPALSRLVAVPKTSEKPRLISIEPSTHQFIQQSIKDRLYEMFRSIRCCNLDSQEPNQALAWYGSFEGAYATIDLSDASDRIHVDLVKHVFSRYPSFLRAIMAVRTRDILLPSGRVMRLNKYASMGSALTFPIQVILFTGMALLARVLDTEESVHAPFVRSLAQSEDFRIYGDDIIVPNRHAQTTIEVLEAFGLRVNQQKSFTYGLFRESCGGDYFAGHDVSIVYRRRRMPQKWRDTSEIVSLAAFANLYQARFGHSPIPDLVADCLTAVGCAPYRCRDPWDRGSISVYGEPSPTWPTRYNADLQQEEVRVPVLVTKDKPTRASDAAVLRHSLFNVGLYEPDQADDFKRCFLSNKSPSHGVVDGTLIRRRWARKA